MEQVTEHPVQPKRDQWPVWRDKWRNAGPNGVDAAASGRRPCAGAIYIYVGMALFVAAACLVNAFSVTHDLMRSGQPHRFWEPFVWEASSAILIIALLALPRQAARLGRDLARRPLLASLNLAGLAVAFSALHICGMVLLRHLAYAAAATAYSFHWSAGNVVYEVRKDLFSFALIAVVFWLTEQAFAGSGPRATRAVADDADAAGSVGPNAGAQLAEPPAAGSPLWLRDGRTSILIDAGDILWLTSAGNYVEYVMATGKRHLIRTTLQAEAERLSTLGIVRVHRTRLVNVKRIVAIAWRPSGDFDLRLDNGETIAGSRRFKAWAAGIGAPAPQAAVRP